MLGHIVNRNPHAANAWLAAALSWFDSDDALVMPTMIVKLCVFNGKVGLGLSFLGSIAINIQSLHLRKIRKGVDIYLNPTRTVRLFLSDSLPATLAKLNDSSNSVGYGIQTQHQNRSRRLVLQRLGRRRLST